MCLLCHSLAGSEHWSDARPPGLAAGAQRARRRRILARVLGAHGLDYADDPSGMTAIVSDRKGDVRVVRDLGEVWHAAAQIRGAPLDPLDPAFLARLAP